MEGNIKNKSMEVQSKNPASPFQNTVFFEWMTPAYRQAPKSKGWYALMGLILLVFIAYDLYTGGWIVSITMLILAAVYYLSEMKPAPTVKVSISDHEVRFGALHFQYGQLKSFWILDEEDAHVLHFKSYKGVPRQIAIFIPDDINLGQLREVLLLQLPEEEGKKEAFSDQLIRNLGL